ncbi:MAG: GIY-YIG nuclease family protein [Elusimicrobia bacterium]|nr:GIY-YIG nuclease family protein [Elusimicrobiota bacterium]
MWYVYVLKSQKDGTLYTGLTEDLKRRIKEHNSGKSDFTSKYKPFILIYYEAFIEKEDAVEEEQFLKSGYGREIFQKKAKRSIES